ncbi:MAG: hypothetical protein AB1512_02330 [Thermodesulfobacteriota bacterium]
MSRKKSRGRDSNFIVCPKSKNLSRRHVDVCRTCRGSKKCKAYQEYLQPLLPLRFH